MLLWESGKGYQACSCTPLSADLLWDAPQRLLGIYLDDGARHTPDQVKDSWHPACYI